MALTIGDRAVRSLTAQEVLAMVDAGILSEDEPVELLHGALTEVSPQSEAHGLLVQRLTRWLAPLVAAGAHDLRVQLPLLVPDGTSLPEPDIAVVKRDDAAIAHPTTALLIVEVSVSSLRTDLTVKPALYAAAGVPEYWIVDVAGQRVERLRDPAPSFAAPRSSRYATRTAHGRGGAMQPLGLGLGVAPLGLQALFEGL